MSTLDKYFSFISAFVILLSATFLNVVIFYYSIIIIAFLIAFLKFILPYKPKFNIFILFFLLIAWTSTLYNEINPLFKPYEKLIIFTLIVSVFGPLFNTNSIQIFRHYIFKYLKILIILFVFFSFILYFVGFGISSNSKYLGLSNHSMVMGPLSALSALICIDLYVNIVEKRKKIIYFTLFIISILNSLLAASRSAILAMLAALIIYFLFKSRNLLLTLRYLLLFSILVLLIYNNNPFGVLDNLISKIENRQAIDNITSDRNVMWNDRIKDFKMSPLIGVGYSNYVNITYSKVNLQLGEAESGGGWIFLLSTLGLLGFCFYLIPLIIIFSKFNRNSPISVYLLIFFIIHSFAEGYMLSIGHLFALIMWLSISTSLDFMQKKI